MTIAELYEYAKKNGCIDYDIEALDEDDYECCHDAEIGWDNKNNIVIVR